MIFNLKRAVSLHLFAAAILAAPFFANCGGDEEGVYPREVRIKDENDFLITGDTIPVKIGSANKTIITLFYRSEDYDHLTFWRQYDNNEPEDLSPKPGDTEFTLILHEDYEIHSGMLREDNSGWEEVRIRTAFSKKFVHVGSIVKIWACVSNDVKGEVWYKVIE